MFNRILIANRGEIALRVIRAARECGIESVALYTPPDRASLHVRRADFAFPVESYLNQDQIIRICQQANAQAIHPGYGFLAENASFSRKCRDNGLVFIGPPPEAMDALGEKINARQTMHKAGVPIVPGALEGLKNADAAKKLADEIGYPVMLKAAAGGGGKGMRLVHSPDEMAASFERAQSEALKSFADGTIYLEKAITAARHVEVQFVADARGNVVHFGERDCSLQRRHQKLIEESPSPAVTPEIRSQMTQAALNAAKAAGYVNAGTCEFLLAPNGEFYFLEVNARLQVEHCVSEMVTNQDLVKWQFEVAAGNPLPQSQKQITFSGHSIECRVCAEDPYNNFMPSAGKVQHLELPSGPFVRVDSALYQGMTVETLYDPMLAKIIVWGENRASAIERMRRALEETRIVGITTNIPFHLEMMRNTRFCSGEFDTKYLETEWQPSPPALDQPMRLIAASAGVARKLQAPKPTPVSGNGLSASSAWKIAARKAMLRQELR
jgi:acetyl-CoA carboxylase biotin carboxylase subunit